MSPVSSMGPTLTSQAAADQPTEPEVISLRAAYIWVKLKDQVAQCIQEYLMLRHQCNDVVE
jgi:hypothetical protein